MPHRPAAATAAQAVCAQLGPALAAAGLNILQPFSVQAYNGACPPSGQLLPTYGRSRTLALLIGNSAALWRPFVAWLAEGLPARLQQPNPLDAYVGEALAAALGGCAALTGVETQARLSTDTGERFVDSECWVLHLKPVQGLLAAAWCLAFLGAWGVCMGRASMAQAAGGSHCSW